MKKECAMYSYGVTGFSYCYNKETKQLEDNLMIMHYGNGKKFVFQKDKAFDLICAINGKQNPNGSNFDKKTFDFELKYMDILTLLKSRLLGKGFIMVTTFKNPVEYVNGVQNSFVGITGLDLDGKPFAKSTEAMFKDGFANYDVDKYSEPPKDYKPERVFQA